MSGIYIHIPYCRKACTYCNFHFSTQLQSQDKLVSALVKEISLQKDYLGNTEINTIYFGGGTPSVLKQVAIQQIMDALHADYSIANDAEITFELNPDDASVEALETWQKLGINRLSVGVQSFQDDELVFMNRSHNAAQSLSCIQLAKQVGFNNISLDLIYGGYKTSNEQWQKNIDTFLSLDIPHLSAYALTVEDKTKLGHDVAKGLLAQPSDAKTIEQFEMLMDNMASNKFEHYEISNFATAGKRAVHNSNYWNKVPYLGIGPAAHSFNQKSRQWNVANNAKYINAIEQNAVPFEQEILSTNDSYNEYIMTGLRTSQGCSRTQVEELFETEHLTAFNEGLQQNLSKGTIVLNEERYVLTRSGKFIADSVMADFFIW